MSQKIAIIGAGVSGAMLAHQLRDSQAISVFEKARGAGGRLSRLTHQDYAFDKGAQDFKLNDNRAIDVIDKAIHAGVISRFRPRFMTVTGDEHTTVNVDDANIFCGSGNINAFPKWLLAGVEVHYGEQISRLLQKGSQWFLMTTTEKTYGPFDKVVMSQPAEQVQSLSHHFDDFLKDIRYSSCLVACLGLKEPLPKHTAEVIKSNGTLVRWIIQSHLKPCMQSLPALTLQSKNIHNDTLVAEQDTLICQMVSEVETMLGLKLAVNFTASHRWRFAKCLHASNHQSLWAPEVGLGVIGDGLVAEATSGVEGALLSALHMANRLQALG